MENDLIINVGTKCSFFQTSVEPLGITNVTTFNNWTEIDCDK